MPAIKYLSESATRIVNSHTNILAEKVGITTAQAGSIAPEWFGFVSLGTAMQFKRGRIVKLSVVAVSGGDGSNENDWFELPAGHYCLGWWIAPSATSGIGELFGLVDHLGWPMTTLRYDERSGMLL